MGSFANNVGVVLWLHVHVGRNFLKTKIKDIFVFNL